MFSIEKLCSSQMAKKKIFRLAVPAIVKSESHLITPVIMQMKSWLLLNYYRLNFLNKLVHALMNRVRTSAFKNFLWHSTCIKKGGDYL